MFWVRLLVHCFCNCWHVTINGWVSSKVSIVGLNQKRNKVFTIIKQRNLFFHRISRTNPINHTKSFCCPAQVFSCATEILCQTHWIECFSCRCEMIEKEEASIGAVSNRITSSLFLWWMRPKWTKHMISFEWHSITTYRIWTVTSPEAIWVW